MPGVLILHALVFVLLAWCPAWSFHRGPREAGPQTYYVSPQGQNTNTCASAKRGGSAAKRSLNGADAGIACLHAGDTLIVEDGTYAEQISDTLDSEHPGTTRPPAGTPGAYTTIKAANARKAILTKPAPGPPVNHVVMLAFTSYVAIEGFVLDSRGHGACVWLGPSSYLRLRNNLITNCGGNGIYADHSNDENGKGYEILDNEIVNVSMEYTTHPGAHAIYNIGREGRTAGNYIHGQCPFYGIHFNSETGGIYANVIENNRVVHCGQAGILNQGADTIVRNNLVESSGVGIQCNGSPRQAVLNNTIYGWWQSPQGGDDSYGILDLTDGCQMANNIILQQRDVSSVPRYIYAMRGHYSGQHNLCDGVYPQHCQQHTSDANAVLIHPAQGDLRLKDGSPALDAGMTLTQVPTDRNGVSRPQHHAYDLGAYEGVGSTPPIPPEPEPPEPGPRPPLVLTCAGEIGAVPGSISLECRPKEGGR